MTPERALHDFLARRPDNYIQNLMERAFPEPVRTLVSDCYEIMGLPPIVHRTPYQILSEQFREEQARRQEAE